MKPIKEHCNKQPDKKANMALQSQHGQNKAK